MDGLIRRVPPNGARVRVRNHFDGGWSSGFEVERQGEAAEDGRAFYILRRLSDGSILPVAFDEGEVVPEG